MNHAMQTYPSTPNTADILTEDNDAIFYDAASNWQRLANWIIDLFAYYFVLFAVFFSIGVHAEATGSESSLDSIDEQSSLFYNLIFILSYILFMTLLEGITKGRSLGKWITRTKIITQNRQPINFRHAFLRSVSRMVPFETISIFFAGIPWHDKWTKTQVIKTNRF